VSDGLPAEQAAAQPAGTDAAYETKGKEASAMRIVYEESLSARSVIDSNGRLIGEVAALILDAESWRVLALRVKLNNDVAEEIGAAHGTFRAARLDVPCDFIQNVTDTLVLKGPVSVLHTLEGEQEQPSTQH
jgi:sporulation protein YlmC with PRC-barrel domain